MPFSHRERLILFRIYYHLYVGPSWSAVWSLHLPLLEAFATSGLLEKLVICLCGTLDRPLPLGNLDPVEIRQLTATLAGTNEFHTLAELHRDARSAEDGFDHCAYLHSKGSSSVALTATAADWSRLLATALLRSMPCLPVLGNAGFNCLGSNLAFGIFHDFDSPLLHYSGNFWCASRPLIASARPIVLGSRHAAVRHNAECWLASARDLKPFNLLSTGIDHYAGPTPPGDWQRLPARLASALASTPAAYTGERIAFLRGMIERSTGRTPVRRFISNLLLQLLPYHRWPVWLSIHDRAMRALGSRKSTYFYCPESQ